MARPSAPSEVVATSPPLLPFLEEARQLAQRITQTVELLERQLKLTIGEGRERI